MTRFVEIALFTDVVDATRAFYERLLDARPEAFWPGGALFAAGEVKLLVHDPVPGAGQPLPPACVATICSPLAGQEVGFTCRFTHGDVLPS